MVEEAAGTGMYESKRDETQKLLKNKDTKMKEINSVIHTMLLAFNKKLTHICFFLSSSTR